MSVPASTPAANGFRYRLPPGGAAVDHLGGEVGVAEHATQTREVLHRRGHPGVVHPLAERRHVTGHRRRIRPVAAAQHTDRLVAALQVLRHHVGHRCQIGVHPARCSCRPQRAARVCSSAGESSACCWADGIRSKPWPCRRCTWPPSWSAATSVSTSFGVRAAPRARSITEATRAEPAVVLPSSRTEPARLSSIAVAADELDPAGRDGDHDQLADLVPQTQRARQGARSGPAPASGWRSEQGWTEPGSREQGSPG